MRSRKHGAYYIHPISSSNAVPADTLAKNPFQPLLYQDDPGQLAHLKLFQKAVEQTGAKLILYTIPGRGYMPYRPFVQALADTVGLPAVLPEVKAITVFDGRHLSEKGAIQFTSKLANEIDQRHLFQ